MKIQITGLNHQIQSQAIQSWGRDGKPQAFEKIQKDHFTQLIQQRIRERKITLICEEARHGQLSLVEAVCRADNCVYSNIEMLPEERQRQGIANNYAEDDAVPQVEKDRCNTIREARMFDRVLALGQGHESVLVLCGRMHAEPLAARLRDAGHTVEIDDLLNQGWYVEDWLHHIMHNL